MKFGVEPTNFVVKTQPTKLFAYSTQFQQNFADSQRKLAWNLVEYSKHKIAVNEHFIALELNQLKKRKRKIAINENLVAL